MHHRTSMGTNPVCCIALTVEREEGAEREGGREETSKRQFFLMHVLDFLFPLVFCGVCCDGVMPVQTSVPPQMDTQQGYEILRN